MLISDLDTTKNETITLHLKHPTVDEYLYENTDPKTGLIPEGEEKGTPITFTGYGKDSSFYQNQIDEIKKQYTPKEFEKLELREFIKKQAAHVMTGWTGINEEVGQPMVFSRENAKKVLEKWPWAKEQWISFIEDRANFL